MNKEKKTDLPLDDLQKRATLTIGILKTFFREYANNKS